MEILKYEKSHSNEVMCKIPEVIEWFKSKGFNSHCSRYSRYVDYIDAFYRDGLKSPSIMNDKFIVLTKAFQECLEICLVYNQFKDETSKGFLDRLEKVIKGQDFLINSPDVKDSSRDFLYELLVSANYKAHGFHISFDENTDVVASKNNTTIYIECKRLKSKYSLEKNMEKALKQLKTKNCNNAINYSFVYIDIINCITDKIKTYEYSSIPEMNSTITKAVQEFYYENSAYITRLNDEFYPYSHGLCLTSYKCLWLSDGSVQYFSKVKANTSIKVSEMEFEAIQNILT